MWASRHNFEFTAMKTIGHCLAIYTSGYLIMNFMLTAMLILG